MKVYFLITVFFLLSGTYAQKVASFTGWKTDEEFKSVEKDIVENIHWLEKNPFPAIADTRKDVAAYVLKWLTGCTYVTVEVDVIFINEIPEKYNYKSDMLLMYMFGMALYFIENPTSKDNIKACTHGIICMINLYQEIIKTAKDGETKAMKKFIKKNNKKELEEYVKKKMKKLEK